MDFNLDILLGILTPEEEQEIKSLDFQVLEKLESEEDKWLKQKSGKFSASKFFRLMGYEDKNEFPKGAETYVIEKVLETETIQEKKQLFTKSILWGSETEIEAVLEFQKKTGLKVDYYGHDQKFIEISDYVGCTPDGLIGEDEGIETKCPDTKTHYDYLRFLNKDTFKTICNEYYWQIQGSLYITGRKKWYFVSYDPRFKNESKRLLIIEIERNEADILKLKKRLFTAVKKLKEQLNDLRN